MVARTFQRLSADTQALETRLAELEVCSRDYKNVTHHRSQALLAEGVLEEAAVDSDQNDHDNSGADRETQHLPSRGASVHEDGSVTFRFDPA